MDADALTTLRAVVHSMICDQSAQVAGEYEHEAYRSLSSTYQASVRKLGRHLRGAGGDINALVATTHWDDWCILAGEHHA